MADKMVFGGRDIRGENYSGPPKAQEVQNPEAVEVLDAEMVSVHQEGEEEEQVPDIEPTQPVPRFECASL